MYYTFIFREKCATSGFMDNKEYVKAVSGQALYKLSAKQSAFRRYLSTCIKHVNV